MGISLLFSISALVTVVLVLNYKVKQYSYYRVQNEELVGKIEENKKEYLAQIEKAREEISAKELELENITTKIDEIEKIMGEEISSGEPFRKS